MPFGLVNSGATLAKALRKIIQGVKNIGICVDDITIIIYSNTWNEHIDSIDEVLQRLKDANETLNPSKCTFGQEVVEFIGHLIKKGEVKLKQENVIKIIKADRQRTKK